MTDDELVEELRTKLITDDLKEHLTSGMIDNEKLWNSLKETLSFYMIHDEFVKWCEDNDIGEWDEELNKFEEPKCASCPNQKDNCHCHSSTNVFNEKFTSSGVSRFDLEQDILEAWKITNDIAYLVDSDQVTDDNVACLHEYYEIRFNKLWDTFEKLIAEKKL